MGNGTTNENKPELGKELKDEDKKTGDDQSNNPRRDKYTTLHGEGGEGSAGASPSTTPTPSPSPTDTPE